jgi:hypothetical protein
MQRKLSCFGGNYDVLSQGQYEKEGRKMLKEKLQE